MERINSHNAASKIRQYIVDNDLKCGDKLPSEKDLTDLLDVGRSSLREGLRMLEGMGVLRVFAGKGAYVEQINVPVIHLPLTKGRDSLLQTLEVRHIVELGAVMLAIEHATDEDISRIRLALEQMEEYDRIDTRSAVASAADLIFHKAVYESGHNAVFMNIIEGISENYYKFWDTEMVGMFSATLKYHRLIYLSIKCRDMNAAHTVVKDMIQALRDSLEFLAEATEK